MDDYLNKMNKRHKISKLFFLILLFSFSGIFSLKIASFIAETFFFDKLFYQKSTHYGYWVPNKTRRLQDFQSRTQDIQNLREYISKNSSLLASSSNLDPKVLGTQSDETFTIFLIGDSYIFGQGIKVQERLAEILRAKLSTLRKTQVIVLGNSGDNLFDNYIKYKAAIFEYGQPNLTLFGLVFNDLLLNKDQYDLASYESIMAGCSGSEVYEPFYSELNDKTLNDKQYVEVAEASFASETKNFCGFLHILPLLPKERTLYLDLDGIRYPDLELLPHFYSFFRQHNLSIFSFDPYYQKNKKNYFFQEIFKKHPLLVSNQDSHPSRLANQIYADALFEEITTNAKWNFRQK